MSVTQIVRTMLQALETNTRQFDEPLIGALLNDLDTKALFQVLKGYPDETASVFHGFTTQPSTLRLAPVRRRLAQQVARHPGLQPPLLEMWAESNGELVETLHAMSVADLKRALPELAAAHGRDRIAVACWLDGRKTVTPLAVRVMTQTASESTKSADATPAVAPVSTATPESVPESESAVKRLQRDNRRLEKERDDLRKQLARRDSDLAARLHELQRVKTDLSAAKANAAELRAQRDRLQRQRDRLQRQVDAAAQKLQELEQQVRKQPSRQPSPAVAPAPQPEPPVVSAAAPAPVPKAAPVPATLSWKDGGRKHSVDIEGVLSAVLRNDLPMVRAISRALKQVRRDNAPAYERLMKALRDRDPFAAAVLTQDTRGVIVDGSNVAHAEKDRHGKARLNNLLLARQALRQRGFFPILIYVDASLPYQVDDPTSLERLISRGEVASAATGTSADEIITREARDRGCAVMTNDQSFTHAIDPDLELPVIRFEIFNGEVYLNETR